MKIAAASALLGLLYAASAFAHNLDEYLQAAVISLHPDEVHVSLRLVPGIAVLPELLKGMDTNSDGVLSDAEQRAYTARVLADLSLRIDGAPVALQVQSAYFPAIALMKEGLAEIRLEIVGRFVNVPPQTSAGSRGPSRATAKRTLVFENRHLSSMSAYLANTLVPSDKGLEIVSQRRNGSQSFYEVRYREQVEAGR